MEMYKECVLLCRILCPFLFCNHLIGEKSVGNFALIGPRREETGLRGFANNKGATSLRIRAD